MAEEQTEFIITEQADQSNGSSTPEKRRVVKKTAKKAAKKATAKKAAKKAAKKSATKKAAKKAVAKKATAKKTTAKKTAKKTTAQSENPASEPQQDKAPGSEAPATGQTAAKGKPAAQPATKSAPRKASRKILSVPEGMKNNAPAEAKGDSNQGESSSKDQASQASDTPMKDGRPMGRVAGGGRVNNDRNRKRKRKKNGRYRDQDGEGGDEQRDSDRSSGSKFSGEPYTVEGILESTPKGFGFLREPDRNYEQSRSDVFVPPDLIQNAALRSGQYIKGQCQKGPRGPQLLSIDSINEHTIEEARSFPHFEELKAVNPDKRISFETVPERFTTRVLDIIAPVGRGQRGLIVSPPRAGKTTLLLHIAEAVKELHDENIHLIICLIDERPEEVTEFRRQVPEAEIYASSNDEPARNHTRLAELCIERAKRLVEAGEHVFVLMDSITRLARAYNNIMGGSKKGRGRGIQSGGIMSGALEMPRRLFASARNTREAGSLTILGTALIHTNSKADDAIFQEFKGTGNMELVLDRRIAEHFVFPAVDIFKSGTRREELILPEHTLNKINLIRRGLAGHRQIEAMERLLFFLKKFPSNAQMLLEIKG
ncbi:MAG: transcription termination factor Rho [Verrucomicrobiota bacterium JB023]|nr:transcription termination factor Rho [Verrucomicrobiota bacterium JB023]